MSDDHVYKLIDLVGSSPDGIEPAIDNALARANETLKNLDWFEVRQIRGNIQNGKVGWYQVDMRVGFRLVEHGDAGKDA